MCASFKWLRNKLVLRVRESEQERDEEEEGRIGKWDKILTGDSG
jgi:hypothetical protein